MTSNTMTITIELDRANYTARQYELFTRRGNGIAAKHINGWIDTEIAARAGEVAANRRDKDAVGRIAREISRAVTKRIIDAGYESKYGATDSEPAWLIARHIGKVCRGIAGLCEDDLNAWHIY